LAEGAAVTHHRAIDPHSGRNRLESRTSSAPCTCGAIRLVPTEHCLRYREHRDELIASMEGFVYRRAS
jgi:hypothetical protein